MRIFIIGFMGVGKSYWGRKWSAITNIPFYDLDLEILEAEGNTISQIFEENGEDYFRELEAKAIRKFSDVENAIVSCGGGTPCFHNNMNWINENGVSIYLTATSEYIKKNLLKGLHKRPLLQNKTEEELTEFIETKISERSEFYNMAKYKLNADDFNEDSLNKIIEENLSSQ